MLKLVLITFLLGAFASIINKKISYILAFFGSAIAFIIGFMAKVDLVNFTLRSTLLPKIQVGLNVDPTSGMFLMIASISWATVSLFSIDFGENYSKKMAAFLNLAILGMFIILSSYDSILFLCGWEIMTIFSYLLITESGSSFKEAFQFLAFSEISTLLLIIGFVALYISTHNFSLEEVHSNSITFIVFASIAFFIKMGIIPFHTWLKEAHSKAPSNASALLSAPVTLMGIYGLTRIISITGYTHVWGIASIILGSLTAFWGAMEAAAAKQLKVLPAYSTVENNGMVLAALGLSSIAYSFSTKSTLYQFAFLTAIIITLVHIIAKTLLFLSVGEAKEKLHEEDIDNVRGIHKSVGKIPAWGIVVSGLSFSAFPLLLGYVGEWMLLESIFQSYQFMSPIDRVISSLGGILLSLAMGFASFSMVKLIGYSALGHHHDKKASYMPSFFMHLSEILLITFLVGFSFFASFIFMGIGYSKFVIGALGVPNGWLLASAKPVFGVISPAFLLIVISFLSVIPFLVYINRRRNTKKVMSFNGGLTLKEEEYFTAFAFSFIIEYILRFVYRTKEIVTDNESAVYIYDVFEQLYTSITDVFTKASYRISRFIMNGKVHFYVTYILLFFIFIFIVFGFII